MSDTRTHHATDEPQLTRRVIAMLAVLVFGALVAMLNETALSVALPAIMETFDVEASSAQWLTTGFLLTMAVVIPTTGFLLQQFSTRTLFLAALAIFLAGSLVGAFAPSFGMLLVARVLQATGTAAILPLLMSTTLTVVLAALAFGGIVYALASINQVLQGNWLPLAAGLVAVVALVVFIRRQLALATEGRALLDLAPFRVPLFRRGVAIIAIAMATMLGTVTVLPLHLQGALAVSTLATGLVLLPGGLLQGLVSPLAGRIFDRCGPRPLVVPGAVLMAAGQLWLTTVDEHSSLTRVIIGHAGFNLGMALVMAALMTASLGSLPKHLYGHGSAIVNTLQQLAGAAGSAILVAAMTLGLGRARQGGATEAVAQAAGTQWAFVVGSVLTLVAVGMAFTIRRQPTTTQVPAGQDLSADRQLAEVTPAG